MPVLKIHAENENKIHFITLTTIEWLDIFTKPEYFKILEQSLKYCQQNLGLLLYEFVFMTNHIHLIIQAKNDFKLSQIVASYKRYTTENIKKLITNDSRKYIKALINSSFYKQTGNTFQLWQEYNYPEVIIDEKFLFVKLNYIHQNPIRKGYVENPEDWKYSSAKFYLNGDKSILTIDQPL